MKLTKFYRKFIKFFKLLLVLINYIINYNKKISHIKLSITKKVQYKNKV